MTPLFRACNYQSSLELNKLNRESRLDANRGRDRNLIRSATEHCKVGRNTHDRRRLWHGRRLASVHVLPSHLSTLSSLYPKVYACVRKNSASALNAIRPVHFREVFCQPLLY